jgi:NADPH:quinone reductase-like Zn-dependent oxidoreductase
MVLLDQRIEVVDLPQVHAFSKQPGGFEVSHDLGMGRMLVDMITRGTNVVVVGAAATVGWATCSLAGRACGDEPAVECSALTKKRLAASASRVALRRNSR